MRAAIIVSISLLAASALWLVRLLSSPSPFAPDAGAVMGATMIVVASIAVVGILLGASRLARNLALTVAGAGLVLGLFVESNPVWAAAVALTALSLVGLVGPWTRQVIRRLPAADAPPAPAALLPLVALASPALIAAASPDGLGTVQWIAIGALLLAAFLYARAAPGALLVVRVLLPLVMAVTAVTAGAWPVALATGAVGVALTVIAWKPGARVAIRPLARPGRAVPMLPELVPDDVLDAAGLDRRGRRKDR